jgi:hypothetical protein
VNALPAPGNVRAALAELVIRTKAPRPIDPPASIPRELEQGQRFRMHRDTCTSELDAARVWEVLRVTPGSATVRALSSRHVEIRDDEGKVKASWDAPSSSITISTQASVLVIS